MTTAEEEQRAALSLAADLLGRLRDPAIRELEVREHGVRVRVSKDGSVSGPPAPVPSAAPASAAAVAEPASRPASAGAKVVTAPLTGIFYRSPSQQAPPFVQPGSVIGVGEVIGLIEAMKLFNEVRSTVAGRVARILTESGELVRAHHPLIEVE